MHSYLVIIIVIGVAALGMAWIPFFTKRTNISYAIIYVLLGAILYSITDLLPFPDPLLKQGSVLRLTEMVVIISLMATGLKIDQPFSFRRWKIPFRLVTITMLLSIAAVLLLTKEMFDLDLSAALLLAAVLAPTDPVLASDVQVGPPMEKSSDNIKFSLTAEAGLNDGMAFPFVLLAMALTESSGVFNFQEWLVKDLVLKICIGTACGFLIGRFLAYLLFRPARGADPVIRDGFVAICATLITYGITELLYGYGFVAVFVAAISIRNYELHHDYHRKMHSFTDQIERIFLAIVLILFGGMLVHGIVENITWSIILFSFLCIFIIRPLATWVSLFATGLHIKEKIAISFFGIKGIGSFFYLAYALHHATFSEDRLLWTIVSSVILFSIIIHGTTATYSMKKLGKKFRVNE
jgi:sodium/hydrogen antiporter